ncbi:MAG: lysine exporter LysO family protein [Desulfovibrio sp.]|uniref:Lysine exporter LysO family protein n=1 Tax=Desulfovibrio porci TaxID=2605782 RepID=A0A6L5XP96_9BACT|nr:MULTISPECIES: lysine exporter LysO family protein [Desulfovibrio]MCD7984568.1 lysine exporter LysO family protein [Desulfovibrio sp.]MDY3808922.1 lysine exporter LysO family protein [Desulfovibrio porci]MSS29050.1 lysine exporter LysO family protein [Desulfovibrio porci]
MSGSLLILAFFGAGLGLARLGLIPRYFVEHDATLYLLWLLMGLVGLSIGSDRRLGEILRTLRPRVLLAPLATTVGTFAGVAAASLFLAYSLADCLAVGAGFAYYSLSSIFITQYKGAELGTVALLSNILREILTLVGTPLLVRLLGPLAPISCGGASTMDTTLPIIARYAGRDWIFISIVHAMVLDFSVPFWVIFFCTL